MNLKGRRLRIDATAFVYPEATIIGDVVIGKGVILAPALALRRLGIDSSR